MQHEAHAPGLIFGDHVGADRPHPLDCLLVPEQLEEAERKEPAVDRLDPRVVVEQAEDGADGPALHLGHERQLRHDQVLEACRHVIDLGGRERHEAPGATQAGVVDLEKHPHFLVEPAAVKRADRHAKPLLHSLHHHAQLCVKRRQHRELSPEGVEILDLAEALGLDKPGVVGLVVRHHEKGSRVETLDQKAAFVVERRVRRAADARHALGMEPVLGGVEEGLGRHRIVVTFEKTEEAALLVVPLDVAGIHDGRNPPHVLRTSGREKGAAAGFFVERAGTKPEQFLLRHHQRGYPTGVVAVDPPRQVYEPLLLGPRLDGPNHHIRHGALPLY